MRLQWKWQILKYLPDKYPFKVMIEAIAENGFLELPITAIHKDPFDRLLIAQAISEPLTFLTVDAQLKNYSDLVEVID